MSPASGKGEVWLLDGHLRVITLPDALDRQRRVLRWVSHHGIGSEVFHHGTAPADRITASPEFNPLTRARYGRDHLQPGEVGCLLSHRQLYQQMVNGEQPWILVLEDDVAPCTDAWPSQVVELVERIQQSRLVGLPWVCHLGLSPGVHRHLALRPLHWRRQGGSRTVATRLGQLDPSIGEIWTTHAYLISRQAARRILEQEPPNSYVADDWDQRLRSGILHPMLATLTPLFLPDPRHSSQIGTRTDFCRTAPSRRCSHTSIAYRLNRKTRTLIYRAGLMPVLY